MKTLIILLLLATTANAQQASDSVIVIVRIVETVAAPELKPVDILGGKEAPVWDGQIIYMTEKDLLTIIYVK